MTTTIRSRSSRTAALGLAAAALLSVSGCASDETAQLREALASSDERLSSAEARISELQDRVDRVPDTAALQSQASAAVASAADQARSAVEGLGSDTAAAAQEAVDALPDLPDAQSVREAGDGARVQIEYARDQLPKDSAELEARLREAADAVRAKVPEQGSVEFRVGDQTFRF